MNTHTQRAVILQTMKPVSAWAAMAILAAQLLIAINATAAGYKLADKTGASIAEFRDEIVNVKKEVDGSMAALDKVITTAATDPRNAFKDFEKSVPRVDDAAKKARKRADEMKSRGQAYFKEWEKELASVKSPEIRQLAEERRAKLQAAFDGIKAFMEPARDQFNSWLANMKDLRNYLGNDLTIGGIDAAKELITKTNNDGHEVQKSLDKVISELNTVVATVTPATKKK